MMWRNRITRTGDVSPSELLANPKNWRTHPEHQRKALEGVLDEVGFVQHVIVNERTGHMVDGHLRAAMAREAGQESIPVVYVDLSEAEEAEILATLDPIGALAGTDAEKLESVLHDVSSASAAVQEMLSELAGGAGIDFGEKEEPAEDPGAQIDRADELLAKWGVERGQVWQVGRHRVMCGDCGKDIEKLFGTENYGLLVTDPPYGVSYAAKNEFLNSVDDGNRVQAEILNDHKKPEEMFDFWCSVFSSVRKFASSGASYYVTGPQGGDLLLLLQALSQSGFPLRHMLIWVKNNFVLGRSDYNYQHEPIIYGWVKGSHKFFGGGGERSVWEVDKPHSSKMHPTMKPVELFARAIKNSSDAEDIVFDPFLGSGTTAVATEQLGRTCYGMEIEPKYVAVTLERLADMGLEPKLV